jgi:protein disulfide-isomerase-like protein
MKSLAKITKKLSSTCMCISVLIVILILVALYLLQPQFYPVHEGLEDAVVPTTAKTAALFYAPWCGHCKKIMPTWDRVAETHKGNGLGEISIVKINCDEDSKLAKKHGVDGYPTIKYLPNGLSTPSGGVEFQGNRSYDGLIEFFKSHM